MTRVAIVGAGITGLALAEALERMAGPRAIEVKVFERHERAGGNIRSDRIDGYLCEFGPNGFLDNAPDTLALVDRLGLGDRLLRSCDAARHRFIFRRGRLREIPTSPFGFVLSDLLSPLAKLRVIGEPFARKRTDPDESIHAFASRRIGSEAADVLVGAMVSGVFAGDASALSLRACFPKMWEMETAYGSLVRAMIAKRRGKRAAGNGIGAPAGTLTSFAGGLQDLVDGLMARVGGSVELGVSVVGVAEDLIGVAPGRFRVDRTNAAPHHADVLVLAGPAAQTSLLLQPIDPVLSHAIGDIPSAPLVVVNVGYRRTSVPRSLNGFGFLVPQGEGPRVLGVLWDSSILPGRAGAGRVLLRAMVGGAHDPGAVTLSDDVIIDTVRADLSKTMGITDPPAFLRIVRHHTGIPQYTIGHPARLAHIDTLVKRHPGLYVTGNSYRGVSMNACIAEAQALARRIVDSMTEAGNAHSPVSSVA